MGNIVQFSINIAIESTLILLLVILFITCLFQMKLFAIKTSFCYLLSFMILILMNQLVIWTLLINNVPVKYGAMPMRVVYIFDYILYYGISVALFYYVEDLVKDGYARMGTVYNPPKSIHIAMIVWGIVNSIIYGISLFIPSIYRVEDGVAVYRVQSYVIMQIMIKFACICAILLIIRYRKAIGKHDAILCLVFAILACVFEVVDEICGLCISYVLVSLYIFILYLRIDIHKGLRLERQEKEITQWKTQIMLSQMQPHFIYNVLTTISSLCELQNALQARDVVNRFADYFRTNLDSLGKDKMIPFEKELEHIKTYLWLEKIRFEDALNICYEIETTDFSVPSLTVQPMVENAVKHGILPKENVGTVTVKTYETEGNYVIVVEDDGVGFDVNKKMNDNSTHVGIENVSKRLEVICNGTFEIQSEIGKGTVVTLSIPKGE